MIKAACFRPVYLGADGMLKTAGDLIAAGSNGEAIWEMSLDLLSPFPAGADILSLPGRAPIAIDPASGEAVVIDDQDRTATAVAAALPMGFSRTLLPATEDSGLGPILPLFGYTAMADCQGQLYVAAVRTDAPGHWAADNYGQGTISKKVKEWCSLFPANRVLGQLKRCATEYQCRTAQNLFLGFGEAGLPSAQSCNAACLGCISLQPAECCPSPQDRIGFTPTADELAELAVIHLENADGAIVSFGQGCEGEPLTNASLLAQSIAKIRSRTCLGTVNINSNGGDTNGLRQLIDAGLNSVRISLFSAIDGDYQAYHQPKSYSLNEVRASLRLAVNSGCNTSLNLLAYPGFTDDPAQAGAMIELCQETGLHVLQIRNLNIDPRIIKPFLRNPDSPGICAFIQRMQSEIPSLKISSYTRPHSA